MALNKKQKLFLAEFLIDRNATQAAIRAGYSVKTAYSIGHDLLKKPEIKEKIDQTTADRMEQARIESYRVFEEEACIAFSDIGDFYRRDGGLMLPHELSEKARRAVKSFKFTVGHKNVSMEYKLHDKGASLERIQRCTGMQTDNQQQPEYESDGYDESVRKSIAMIFEKAGEEA